MFLSFLPFILTALNDPYKSDLKAGSKYSRKSCRSKYAHQSSVRETFIPPPLRLMGQLLFMTIMASNIQDVYLMDGLFVISKNAYELLGHRLSAKTCFLKKFSYFLDFLFGLN